MKLCWEALQLPARCAAALPPPPSCSATPPACWPTPTCGQNLPSLSALRPHHRWHHQLQCQARGDGGGAADQAGGLLGSTGAGGGGRGPGAGSRQRPGGPSAGSGTRRRAPCSCAWRNLRFFFWRKPRWCYNSAPVIASMYGCWCSMHGVSTRPHASRRAHDSTWTRNGRDSTIIIFIWLNLHSAVTVRRPPPPFSSTCWGPRGHTTLLEGTPLLLCAGWLPLPRAPAPMLRLPAGGGAAGEADGQVHGLGPQLLVGGGLAGVGPVVAAGRRPGSGEKLGGCKACLGRGASGCGCGRQEWHPTCVCPCSGWPLDM